MTYKGKVTYYDKYEDEIKTNQISFDTNTRYGAAFIEVKKIVKAEMDSLTAKFAHVNAYDGDAVFEEWFSYYENSSMNKI